MPVPLLDLKRHYQPLASQIEAAVLDVVRSGGYIAGPYQTKLEQQMCQLTGAKHAIAVSSGTDALLVSLMALDIGPNDEVITTPYTFFATAGCIARLGAKPVFLDIDPATFNINAQLIPRAITKRTKAILPVHLFGQPADMTAINAIAAQHNLHVIEDACQAIGASRDNKQAGAMGHIACFSFYPTKNVSGLGDGGIVTTIDSSLGEKIAILRNHGMNPRYFHKYIGGNFRLDAIQCAGLTVKMPHLRAWNEARRRNAARYRQLFTDAGLTDKHITLPIEVTQGHIYHQYVIRVTGGEGKRDALLDHLRKHQIGCEIYYPLSLHQQECFKYLGHSPGSFPESERAAKESIALPIFPELTDAELSQVVEVIAKFYS